jgi:hypothetical protein
LDSCASSSLNKAGGIIAPHYPDDIEHIQRWSSVAGITGENTASVPGRMKVEWQKRDESTD